MTRIIECTRCGGSTQDWDIHYDGLCGECVLEVGDFMNEDKQGHRPQRERIHDATDNNHGRLQGT